MASSIKNIFRLLAIAKILARHNALFSLEKLSISPAVICISRFLAKGTSSKESCNLRPGQRLALAFNEAGPSFIKLGQALATRSDFLGDELAKDLSDLQDKLPPFEGALACSIIEEEFGQPLDKLFTSFEMTPIAAASIAQVRFAITTEGAEVAVKILRPGVEIAFKRDLELMRWIASMLVLAKPDLKRLKPSESVEALAQTVELEMDLRFEAAAAGEISDNFKNDNNFCVPKVDWQRTGRRVLTTERLVGIPLDQRDAIIAAGHDPKEVLRKASEASFKQVFCDGFFHADVHPGNLFVMNTGAIGAVDFGIMGRLDIGTRRWLGEMLLAFLSRDYRRAAEIHFEAGLVPQNKSVEAFTQACRSIAEPILDRPQNEISIGRLLGQLFQISKTFQMEAQPQLLLLQKTMLVAEGTGRRLAPEANMWVLARPMIEKWFLKTLSPETRILETVNGIAKAAVRLPKVISDIEKGAALLSKGLIQLHPETIEELKKINKNRHKKASFWFILYTLLITLGFLIIT
jgi:ubiquinone biosynthesis protein